MGERAKNAIGFSVVWKALAHHVTMCLFLKENLAKSTLGSINATRLENGLNALIKLSAGLETGM